MKPRSAVRCLLLSVAAACGPPPSMPDRPFDSEETAAFGAGGLVLRVEALKDDLVHFELVPARSGLAGPIATSPMVYRSGAPVRWTRRDASSLETKELRVEIDRASLCAKVSDLRRGFVLHRACPRRTGAGIGIAISRERTDDVYGLGEQFVTPGATDGDWIGKRRTPGNELGNAKAPFDFEPGEPSGGVGNAQFPVLYAVGPGKQGYAMFVDDPYAETWSFQADPWTLDTRGPELRWYVDAGPDLPDLRRDVMDLLGRPPVPPRKAFGLWISEYGFDDWKELEDKLATLRTHHFPVDGFVLDLQWFGNVTRASELSRMGTLTWDKLHFPDPERKIAELRDKEGVGIVLIEESYVSRGLPEHAELAKKGYLAKDCPSCPPTYFGRDPWWGKGGMIDWSNTDGADHWHETKRLPLVKMGVLGHWCDLGEPEMFSPTSVYAGVRGRTHEEDVHDLFSFLWVESIARGYVRDKIERRPFVMARSGAPGIQRFGASMWSGDIGSNLTTLATHLNVQMHMSMSGIDYFGSDIGGFVREALRGDLSETYTQWFADGMAVDVPGRVHTSNVDNDRESAPDRVGDVASNLANVRRRYELVPYVYSLAHRAWRDGDPVFPPLVWAYQDDPAVRQIGGEKLVGRDVLVALVAKSGARTTDVYFPRDDWYDIDGKAKYAGGQVFPGIDLYADGIFRLPMFARGGAILPLAHVDDQTWNVMGRRGDGSHRDELRVRVFAASSAEPTRFDLVEDDGETIAYQHGQTRTTTLSQRTDHAARKLSVSIGRARGTFTGASVKRDVVVEMVLTGLVAPKPTSVLVDGAPLPEAAGTAGRGWHVVRPGVISARLGESATTVDRSIIVGW